MKSLLVTGGAGFIGSHVARHFAKRYRVLNLDNLTYAGNLANLKDLADSPNYEFCRGSICDAELLDALFQAHNFDGVLHLAAESHVDRSIAAPLDFVTTNVLGTATLLQAARKSWKDDRQKCFYHVSTDEVYGSLGEEGLFREDTPYAPRSPYSATKAASDHLVRAFHETYGLPVKISNCSNNYGPNQFPEKLIPLCIENILRRRPIPVYGSGLNVRDWLYVQDHVEAIDQVLHNGVIGETYNIGGNCEAQNIQIVKTLCRLMDAALSRTPGDSEKLITFVTDRAGHDFRYAIDSAKITRQLGWQPKMDLEDGLKKTVAWYLENEDWVASVTSGAYKDYYQQHYGDRQADERH